MRWLELPNFDSTVTGRRARDNRLVAAVAGAVAGASYLAPTCCIAGETAGFGAAGLCSAIQPSPPDQIRSVARWAQAQAQAQALPPQRAIAIAHPRCISYRKKCVLNSKIALGGVTDSAEQLDKLVISQVGLLAQRRLARGVKLNHSEACVCWLGP
jgi:hypothetical protein